MAKIKNWRGEQIKKLVASNVSKAMGEFGLRVEGHSKRQLKKGQGVITGTLRRSIHLAPPGYAWSKDDTTPSTSSPELGGQKMDATIEKSQITIQVGSGLRYALPVHQGHHWFIGYHFISIGLQRAKPELSAVLKKYALK